MNTVALALFASCITLTNSHDSTSSSQQVVVSCPVGPEVSIGLPGVPGKRGIKGELGVPGLKGEKGEPGLSDDARTELEKLKENILQIQGNLSGAVNFLQQQLNALQANSSTIIETSVSLDGWTAPVENYRYRIVNSTQSWESSRNICRVWGGDLIVHGVQKSRVRATLHRLWSLGTDVYYIGLSDKRDEGYFRWLNGRSIYSSSSLWDLGEPNGGGDCCHARFDFADNLIYDGPCYVQRRAVCERSAE